MQPLLAHGLNSHQLAHTLKRNRTAYAILIAAVTVAGLASRSGYASLLPSPFGIYGGDILWALNVFLTLGFVFPAAPTWRIAAATLAISYSVEFSQFYQADWINRIRQTLPGRLLLGSGFLKSDLACYTIGVAIGAAAESLFRRKPGLDTGRDSR
jgi:Protein of unknown function (DUF2809)